MGDYLNKIIVSSYESAVGVAFTTIVLALWSSGKGVYSTITFGLFHVGKGVCVVFEKYQNHVYPMWVKVFVKVFVYLYLLRNFYNIL